LEFHVSPNLKAIVEQPDLRFIEELLADLPVRAQADAENLYEQLRSLSVGPLVVGAEGGCSANQNYLKSIYLRFGQPEPPQGQENHLQ
jgi:hypothetical protein